MSQDEVQRALGKPQRKGREKRGKVYRDAWFYPGSAVFFDDAGYVLDVEGIAVQ